MARLTRDVLALVVAAILVIGSTAWLPKTKGEPRGQHPAFAFVAKNMFPSKQEIDKSDKLYGRKEYEWLRLRDPATGRVPQHMRSKEVAFVNALNAHASLSKRGRHTTLTQDWSFRGPNNIGGRSRALAIDVSNNQRILAGGVTGGMWLSEDGGDTWNRTTGFDVTPSVTCAAQDTREGHTDTWYYGTGEYTGSGSRGVNSRIPTYTGEGIFKSTDGGVTWTQLESTVGPPHQFDNPFDVVFRIATNPTNFDQDEVFAATFGTIHRSRDGGESWDLILGTVDVEAEAWADVLVTPNGVVYATIASASPGAGIYRSDDSGDTWTPLTPEAFPQSYGRIVMGYNPSDEEELYFFAVTPGSGFSSSGGGISLWHLQQVAGVPIWEDLSNNMPDFAEVAYAYGWDANPQGGYNMVVKVHPDSSNIVYLGGVSLFRSDDAFQTDNNTYWINGYNYYYGYPGHEEEGINFPGGHADIHNLVFDPTNPDIAYCSHDGGISKCENSLYQNSLQDVFPWTYVEGYLTTQFYWTAVDPITDGSMFVMGGMQDNGTWGTDSENRLDPWVEFLGGDGMACDVGAGPGDDWRAYYATTQYGGSFICMVLDDNFDFQDYYWFEPPGGNFDRWITPYEVSAYDNIRLAVAGTYEIYINENFFDPEGNWITVPGSNHENRWVTAVGISASEEAVVYYGDYDPTLSTQSRIYRITDAFGNMSMLEVTDFFQFPVGAWIHCITVDPTDPDKVYAVFTNYNIPSLFYSEDGGLSWTNIGGNLEENPDGSGNGPSCFWMEVVYDEEHPIYLVGTTIGLFSTFELDGENTVWIQEGEDVLGKMWVTHMDVRNSDGFVSVGTHGGGVYSTFATWEDHGTLEQEDGLPEQFEISAVYPNPFNATATVTVTLPNNADLRLDVFNELGRCVTTLAQGAYKAGEHTFTFNGDNLASGTYFMRLQSAGRTATRQITLLK